MSVIDQMLARHALDTDEDRRNALRETAQEIALAGLDRAGFFERAAFYGGTCLRIFHGLPRYSEDLDFSLLRADPTFRLEPVFDAIREEFLSLGWEVEIRSKMKSITSAVESAFLKPSTTIADVRLNGTTPIRIKIEVDTDPPSGFATESKLLLMPYSFHIRCVSLPDLFAGKMHAFMFRSWKQRVKGRDWFDVEWYVRHGHPMNLIHFLERAIQSGHVSGDAPWNEAQFRERLNERIRTVDIHAVKADVVRFVREPRLIEAWSTEHFLEVARRMKVGEG
jgi:predicted nucleotidyltransferase component of viral defense system